MDQEMGTFVLRVQTVNVEGVVRNQYIPTENTDPLVDSHTFALIIGDFKAAIRAMCGYGSFLSRAGEGYKTPVAALQRIFAPDPVPKTGRIKITVQQVDAEHNRLLDRISVEVELSTDTDGEPLPIYPYQEIPHVR